MADYDLNSKEGNETMTDGVGTGQAATLALLADTARAGRGGYFGGGEGGYGGPFASPSSNAVRIESAGRANAAGIENLLDQNQFAATNQNVVDGHARICDRMTDAEFRTGDRLRDIEREMNANARAAAECCCEIKLNQCKDTAELKAEIQASEQRNIQRSLDAANAKITQLETIQAITQACGCCPPPRP